MQFYLYDCHNRTAKFVASTTIFMDERSALIEMEGERYLLEASEEGFYEFANQDEDGYTLLFISNNRYAWNFPVPDKTLMCQTPLADWHSVEYTVLHRTDEYCVINSNGNHVLMNKTHDGDWRGQLVIPADTIYWYRAEAL